MILSSKFNIETESGVLALLRDTVVCLPPHYYRFTYFNIDVYFAVETMTLYRLDL